MNKIKNYFLEKIVRFHWNLEQKLQKKIHDETALNFKKKHLNVLPTWYNKNLVNDSISKRTYAAHSGFWPNGMNVVLFPQDIDPLIVKNSILSAAKDLKKDDHVNFLYHNFTKVDNKTESLTRSFLTKLDAYNEKLRENRLTDILLPYTFESESDKDGFFRRKVNLWKKDREEFDKHMTIVIFDNVEEIKDHKYFDQFMYSMIHEPSYGVIRPLVLTKDIEITKKILGLNGGGKTRHLIINDQESIRVGTSGVL